jgi:hypothetical protein
MQDKNELRREMNRHRKAHDAILEEIGNPELTLKEIEQMEWAATQHILDIELLGDLMED